MCRGGESCARNWRRGASRDDSSGASAMTRPVILRRWSNGVISYFCQPRKKAEVWPTRALDCCPIALNRDDAGDRRQTVGPVPVIVDLIQFVDPARVWLGERRPWRLKHDGIG